MHDFDDGALGPGGAALTPEERRRLRPTVDAAALERYLAAHPDFPRNAIVAHFAAKVTLDDILAFMRDMREAGAVSAAEAAEYERQWREPLLDETPALPERTPDHGGLRFTPVPHIHYVLQLEPPAEPELRALWDAIEPDRR